MSDPNLSETLRRFRAAHRAEQLQVGAVRWELVSGGDAAECLLILTGASGIGELGFTHLMALKDRYRVLLPSYPPVSSMAELADGLDAVLGSAGIGRAHVLGGSFGGLVAQCFVRRHPRRVASLILSHTGLPRPRRTRGIRLALGLVPWIPTFVLRWAMHREALRLLPSEHPDFSFWRAYFRDIFARLAKRDILARYRCILDLDSNYVFSPADTADWAGPVLMLQSDDDPLVSATDRAALAALYPQAQVKTFHGTGHAAALVAPELYRETVCEFLRQARRTAGQP